MTDDYVSFETAKLLKEAGFAEYCNRFFMVDSESPCKGKWKNYNAMEMCFSRPTLSIAAKWMRRKEHVSVEVMWNRGDFCWDVQVWMISDYSEILCEDFSYSTYELALNGGIMKYLEESKEK